MWHEVWRWIDRMQCIAAIVIAVGSVDTRVKGHTFIFVYTCISSHVALENEGRVQYFQPVSDATVMRLVNWKLWIEVEMWENR